MQYFWWRSLWLLLLIFLLCLMVWAAVSGAAALLTLMLCLFALLVFHLYHLRKLLVWLNRPVLDHVPAGLGAWDDVFSHLYHEFRNQLRNATGLAGQLDRLQQAAGALPDGVVMLNATDQIEWCNDTARDLLGLDLKKDTGQQITFLLRNSEFIVYLEAGNYSEPLWLRSMRNPEISLELQLVPFGDEQKLLICRDVSQLEKVETMRRDFVANVSHELRTPLTVVAGFIESLKDTEQEIPEHLLYYFNLMQEQTDRMHHLVEDLLTLSQLERNQSPHNESEVDIAALIETLLQEGERLSGGSHNLLIEHLDREVKLRGSQSELHSAFSNLLANAIRYTAQGGVIRMSWRLQDDQAVFTVQDTGIGIEAQHIPRLTERFYRVDRSRSRETGGTGLGLSIVKHVLTRHQGHLQIISEYGQGSIFSAVFEHDRVIR